MFLGGNDVKTMVMCEVIFGRSVTRRRRFLVLVGERQQRSDDRRTRVGRRVIRFRRECFESTKVLDARTRAGEILAGRRTV